MKVVLANKTVPFYENIQYRKSYIKIENGKIYDDYISMKEEQDKFFNNYFPNDDNIGDKFNLSNTGNFTRTIILSYEDYQGVYPNDYDFWVNVNYLKIVSNQKTEYCYITDRECLNIPTNKWKFSLMVDKWNTKWLEFYKALKSVKNFTMPVARWHDKRFDIINYKGNQQVIYRFLNSQDNSFWNKEQFELNIKSSVPIKQDFTNNVYEDVVYFNKYGTGNILMQLYSKNNNLIPDNQLLWETSNDNLYNTALYMKGGTTASTIPWVALDENYGLINTYWWIPLFRRQALTNVNNKEVPLNEYQRYYFHDDKKISTWIRNSLYGDPATAKVVNPIDDPLVAVIVGSPKPLFLPILDKAPTEEFPKLTFENFCYPIRYRDKYRVNKGLPLINKHIEIGDVTRVESSQIGIRKNKDNLTNKGSQLPNNYLSTENTLCDERIDFNIKNFNTVNIAKRGIITQKDVNIEPKIYDEDFFNVDYSHNNQQPIKISPKWYFYKNFDDLINHKSLFILGYQFIQPQIVILIHKVVSGLYNNFNENSENALYTLFSPNQQQAVDAQQSFLLTNRSQMNATLNIASRNSIIGASGAITGGAVGGAISAGSGNIGGVIGSIVGGIFGGISAVNSYKNTEEMVNARLEDLARAPNQPRDYSSESSFKLVNSYYGLYRINHLSEIDKEKIWTYHAQNGYFYNGLIVWNNQSKYEYKTNSLATRIFYNFWQINNIKNIFNVADVDNMNDLYKEYFDDVFAKGVSLWHNLYYKNTLYSNIGDYSSENWEIELWEIVNNETL